MLTKTYKIETTRLIIRCYKQTDAELLKISIDESMAHLLPWMPWAKNEPESVEKKVERLRKYRGQFDLGLDYTFGIFSKDEKKLIGSTGLHTRLSNNAREIGYWINAKYIKKGYATETVQALMKVGFEIEQLDRIEIRCAPNNIASQGVPKKLRFLHVGTLKNSTTDTEGELRDEMIWAMSKEEYLKKDFPKLNFKAYNIINKQIK